MLPVDTALDLVWSVWVDGYNGMIDPQEVRDELLRNIQMTWPDRETWGTDSAADPATAAMMERSQAPMLTPEEREARRRARDERRQARAQQQ